MRPSLIIAMLAIAGCDTFRSIDSVPVPGEDTGLTDMAEPGDGLTMADMSTPDQGTDMKPADMPVDMPDGSSDMADVLDVTPDGGGPLTCPDENPRTPAFTTSTFVALLEHDLGEATDVPAGDVSIAASEPGLGSAVFVTGHRAERDSVMEAIVTAYPVDGLPDHLLLFHATAQPFTDVAVARSPTAEQFSFLAVANPPTCVDLGIQAISGALSVAGGLSQLGLDSIAEGCGRFLPDVALTGADGNKPNYRVITTDLATGDVRAYPWGSDMATGSRPGTAATQHVSASTRDLVATHGDNDDEWWLWRPGSAGTAIVADIGGEGDLEVEHLYDECYIAAAPSVSGVALAPVSCEMDCAVVSASDVAISGTVSRADVAPMPGGGFVLVTAVGTTTQRLEARFFDDAYQPTTVNGESVIELVPTGSPITDFAIATTRDDEDIFVGVAYANSDKTSLTVLRVYLPDP